MATGVGDRTAADVVAAALAKTQRSWSGRTAVTPQPTQNKIVGIIKTVSRTGADSAGSVPAGIQDALCAAIAELAEADPAFDANTPTVPRGPGTGGSLPLVVAARKHYDQVVSLLVGLGADTSKPMPRLPDRPAAGPLAAVDAIRVHDPARAGGLSTSAMVDFWDQLERRLVSRADADVKESGVAASAYGCTADQLPQYLAVISSAHTGAGGRTGVIGAPTGAHLQADLDDRAKRCVENCASWVQATDAPTRPTAALSSLEDVVVSRGWHHGLPLHAMALAKVDPTTKARAGTAVKAYWCGLQHELPASTARVESGAGSAATGVSSGAGRAAEGGASETKASDTGTSRYHDSDQSGDSRQLSWDPLLLVATARLLENGDTRRRRALLRCFAALVGQSVARKWLSAEESRSIVGSDLEAGAEAGLSVSRATDGGGASGASSSSAAAAASSVSASRPRGMPEPLAASPATQAWLDLKSTGTGGFAGLTDGLVAVMDSLMGFAGLEAVKDKAVELIRAKGRAAALPFAATGPSRHNYAFLGGSKTGKQSAARLFAKLLHLTGARSSDEVTVFGPSKLTELVRDNKLVATLRGAAKGVLIVQNAHAAFGEGSRGREIAAALLDAVTDVDASHSVILVGDKEKMGRDVYPSMPGMKTEFVTVPFDNLTERELRAVWDGMLYDNAPDSARSAAGRAEFVAAASITARQVCVGGNSSASARARGNSRWRVEHEWVSEVACRRVAAGRGGPRFQNAGAVKSALQRVLAAALRRQEARSSRAAAKDKDSDAGYETVITIRDVLPPPPSRETNKALDEALKDLEKRRHPGPIEACVKDLIELVSDNYELQLCGKPPRLPCLNRTFVGNPGCGKTTGAAIFGRIVAALGLVSKGGVEVTSPKKLVQGFIGQSDMALRTKVEEASGRVLIIDEAHDFDDPAFGAAMLNTLRSCTDNNPGDDICIILCGYPKKMRLLFDRQDEGLKRRFDGEDPVVFPDMRDDVLVAEMEAIITAGNADMDYRTPARIRQELKRLRALGQFGNMGAAQLIARKALQGAASRRRRARDGGAASVSTGSVARDVVLPEDVVSGDAASTPPMVKVDDLVGLAGIKSKLAELRRTQAVERRDGLPTVQLGHFVFTGGPGTGKTTVAKALAAALSETGLIDREFTEVSSGPALHGSVVGEAQRLVRDAMARAKGGVLFIDEAYELCKGDFGREATTELVNLLGNTDEYGKTVVVIAGYRRHIRAFLASNAGLPRRFDQNRWHFDDWTSHECVTFVQSLASRAGLQLGFPSHNDSGERPDAVVDLLVKGFDGLRAYPPFGNAGDAKEVVWPAILRHRASRVAEAREAVNTVAASDVHGAFDEVIRTRGQTNAQEAAAGAGVGPGAVQGPLPVSVADVMPIIDADRDHGPAHRDARPFEHAHRHAHGHAHAATALHADVAMEAAPHARSDAHVSGEDTSAPAPGAAASAERSSGDAPDDEKHRSCSFLTEEEQERELEQDKQDLSRLKREAEELERARKKAEAEAAEARRQQELAAAETRRQQELAQRAEADTAQQRDAEQARLRAVERAKQASEAAAAERALAAALELRRQQEAAIRMRQRVRLQARMSGVCPMSFRWRPIGGGWWECEAGVCRMKLA